MQIRIIVLCGLGFVYAFDLREGEIAIDFNAALGGGGYEGDIVLIVPLDAIEVVL